MGDSEDDFGGGGHFDAMTDGVTGGRRSYYDDDLELKKQQKAKDRKQARKQAKVDAKAERIRRQEEWSKQKRMEREKKEEEQRRAKRAKEGKRRYEEQKAAKRAGLSSSEVQKKPTPSEAKGEKKDRKRGREVESIRDADERKPVASKKVAEVKVKAVEEAPPAPAKYVVPARRTGTVNKAGGEVRGLLNRLSLDNITEVAVSISDLYSLAKYSRADVMNALCEEFSKNCFRNTHLTSNSALSYAALIRAIQLEQTSDAIADVVAHTCTQLDDALMTGENDGAVAVNCGMVVAYFYLVHLCDAALPLTLLEMLLRTAAEEDEATALIAVETSLAILRCCGLDLRRSVPVALNRIVNQVQSSETVSRHHVLLDLVKALAAGKKTSGAKADVEVDPKALEAALVKLGDVVKRTSKGMTTKTIRKAVETTHLLGVSFAHCADAEKPPRWHTQKHDVLAQPAGAPRRLDEGSEDDFDGDNDSDDSDSDGEEEREVRKREIEQMREKTKALAGQRLGTETKRAIFDCVTSASDEQECFHMLVRRDPQHKQLSETAAVLLQCAIQESKYNNYYAEVLHRFLSCSKKNKMAIQFAVWDRFKAIRIQPVDITGFVNLAMLLTYLFDHELYPLSMLRGLDLHVESRNLNLFARILVLRLIVALKPQKLATFFFGGDVNKGELSDVNISTTQLRKHLKIFFNQYFVAEDEAGRWIPTLFDVVANGVETDTTSLIETLPGRIEAVRRALRDGV